MQLYGLKQLRVVREEKLDTKCFLAWNEDILVLAFRGTASTRNAISDLQVCFQVQCCNSSTSHTGQQCVGLSQVHAKVQAFCQAQVPCFCGTSIRYAVSNLPEVAQAVYLMVAEPYTSQQHAPMLLRIPVAAKEQKADADFWETAFAREAPNDL